MENTIVYDNIFEAIRSLDPNQPILLCPEKGGAVFRQQNFTALDMGDGTIGAFPLSLDMRYYRGESSLYPSCKANLYRITDKAERLIWELKAWDFILFMEGLPWIQERLQAKEYINFWALAQHYEFPTAMLDISNDLMVAAFFAIHKYNPVLKNYEVQTEGLGQIRVCHEFLWPTGNVYPIGLQPFERPGKQSAFGIWLEEDEDFADRSYSVVFKQDAKSNELFHRSVLGGIGMFFPQEIINFVATTIKTTNVVTSMAIARYCSENNSSKKEIECIVKQKGTFITDAPAVCMEMFEGIPNSAPPIMRKPLLKPAFTI